ncbi:hypothetical protein [Macrococcoides caseolyticum]|uniref:hypothetical protein n=1 Tax=Macrococcoides caseolyticum TaxID=69966 RepID=UPI001F1F1318|nr:hypothetical protein [Macrococcus caseolyticus]MCE4956053.1 hypothetical protein [Macrococcus caseolyticus]
MDEIILANSAIEKMFNNRWNENNFADCLIEICDFFSAYYEEELDFDESYMDKSEYEMKKRCAEEASQMLFTWIEKVRSKEKRSKLMISMVDYV